MKKLLCVFLALLAMICLLTVSVGAAPPPPTLSEDLQTLTFNGQTYTAADVSAMNLHYSQSVTTVQVPNAIRSMVKSATLHYTSNQYAASVELHYTNGSSMNITFVRNDILPELQKICQSDDIVCFIEFWWENTPSVSASIDQLKGKPTTLTKSELMWSDYYEVIYEYSPLNSSVYRGFICQCDGQLYYVDYQENNIYNPLDFYPSDNGPELYQAYEITDPALASQIEDVLASEFSGSSELGQMLSTALLTFLFAVIPAAILILSIIFFIRTKAYYRITWAITGGLCIAELILFIILAILL